MSLKENVEFVKEELSSEEKFFEKAVVTERFVKKYKKPLIGLVSAVVIFALANVAYDVKEQNRISEANAQLAVLMKNPSDLAAQSELKNLSPKLYELWSFSKAIVANDTKKLDELKNSKLPVIGDVAAYEVAQNDQNIEELNAYAIRQDAIYKDLALVESAFVYFNKNEIEKGEERLALVPENSPLKSVVATLEHYGVK